MQKGALNKHKMSGVRIHDYSNQHWRGDVDILVPGCGNELAYITIPKPTAVAQVSEMISYIQAVAKKAAIKREIPIHVLIETHGALRDAFEIAAQPWMQVLDFGLMDFVSGHHGAVPDTCMKSPGQFEHKLLARAKSTVVAAALCAGIVPAHNVTLDLKDKYKTYADASRARNDFGFLRMWSIYPTQIDSIVEAMAPDYSAIQKGCNILLAAQKSDWGPIQFDGDLHDRATYRYYWEIVQKARISGFKLPEDADKAFF
jgi:citrate lyase subunit beta/citryl-CoA lyase